MTMSLNEYKSLRDSSNVSGLCSFFSSIENGQTPLPADVKSKLMTELLEDLDTLPSQGRWSEELTTHAVLAVKSMGRDVEGSDPLFSERGIEVLLKLSNLDSRNDSVISDTPRSREALKCLSNCTLLKDAARVWVVQHGGVSACYRLLASPSASRDVQFLVCRILLFMTVDAPDVVGELVSLGIGPTVAKVLMENTEKIVSKEPLADPSPMTPTLVASEALKLLFNLILVETRRDESKEEDVGTYFSGCLNPIYILLFETPIPKPMPLAPPINYAIQVLMQFPSSTLYTSWISHVSNRYSDVPTEDIDNKCANHICDILEGALNYLIPSGNPDDLASAPSENNVDAIIVPIILVIRRAVAEGPSLRKFYKSRMLPSESDRETPVNVGSRMPAMLIRLMTCTMLPQTREVISDCLFILCNEDAAQFSQEVGYGNAVGFFVNRGIAVEPPAEYAESSNGKKAINPITGQYLDAEEHGGPSLAEMTDEEKEREAERLFVLFERLKKTGVVDVENPVAKAMREGRLQEIRDDEDKDSDVD